MKYGISKILGPILLSLTVSASLRAGFLDPPPPNPADVGDAESFGHNAQYMGAVSGFVTLSPVCTPAPPPVPPGTVNDDQCFNLVPAPAATIFDFDESRNAQRAS